MYACGSGESGSLNMSRNRANLDAKRQLADMIDSEISSRMEDFLSSTGTGANEQILQQSEIITKNVTQILMENFFQVKKQMMLWRV